MRKHPRLNARFQSGKIQLLEEINIGIAAAVEDGLVVPVIHSADEKSVTQIASTRLELVERARSGRLRPEDISGGTFTISNLGMYGVDAFLAVLNPPQAARSLQSAGLPSGWSQSPVSPRPPGDGYQPVV